MSPELLEELLNEEEGSALDFKRDQYPFEGADKAAKGELLKDILALANAWRRTTAYLLIGVEEIQGGRSNVVGVAGHLDDAKLQQFVNSKTQRPIEFSYRTVATEGVEIGVVEIPLQDRPVYLTKGFGKLDKNVVYVRRGSSTATASPDEIARMGRAEDQGRDVALEVFFADPRSRRSVEPTIQSHVLDLPAPQSLPDYTLPGSNLMPGFTGRRANSDYYRKLARFTRVHRLVSPIWLAISNGGASAAVDVRLEVTIPGAKDGVSVLDEDSYPGVPQAEYDLLLPFIPSLGSKADVEATQVGDGWLVTARADKVQPKSTEWFGSPVYVGAETSRNVDCLVRVYADNLPSPHEQMLSLPVESTRETVDLDRIIELEDDRFATSPGHRAFLREHGLENEPE